MTRVVFDTSVIDGAVFFSNEVKTPREKIDRCWKMMECW